MSTYTEYRAYSPIIDAEMVRLSMYDNRGGEFFALVPAYAPKKWRERRDEVLDAIMDAMEAGDHPGEVEIKA